MAKSEKIVLNRNVRHNKQIFTKGMIFTKDHDYYEVFNDKGFFKREEELAAIEAPAAINAVANKNNKLTNKQKKEAKKAAEDAKNTDPVDAPPADEKIVG